MAYTGMPVYAADVLNVSANTVKGKFEMVSDGLIKINEKGVSKTYIRIDDPFNIYSDYIRYRVSPFSRELQGGPCKVKFIDTFIVKIQLPDSKNVEIPRYRVADLEINIKN